MNTILSQLKLFHGACEDESYADVKFFFERAVKSIWEAWQRNAQSDVWYYDCVESTYFLVRVV